MTHSPARIDVELPFYQALKARILEECPDLDHETLADTLQGASNLQEAIAAVVRSLDEDEAMVKGCEDRILELGERRDRFKARIDRKRELVAKAMDEAGIKKLTEPDFTLSLTATPRAVIIADESQLLPEFMVQPPAPPPRPDKKKIKQAILDGGLILGAFLSNAGITITVRRK